MRLSFPLCAAAVASCVSVQPYIPATLGTQHVVNKNYELGEPAEAFVGDPIIKVKDYNVTRRQPSTAVSKQSFTLCGGMLNIPVQAGHPYRVAGTREIDGDTVYVIHLGGTYYAQVDDTGNIRDTVLNNRVAMVYDFRPKPEGSRLIPAKEHEIQAESGYKNFEVIYSGISDTAMQFTYREFTPDNMARPAFFQDLTYSLGSKSLRFRGFKIQVLNASNESVRFIVEEDDL